MPRGRRGGRSRERRGCSRRPCPLDLPPREGHRCVAEGLAPAPRGGALPVRTPGWGCSWTSAAAASAAMPPPRTDEADFNENYQADRRAITRYAVLLAQMQATVKKMILATHAAADQLSSLEFDPFENLGPLSPLKGHHKTLRLAYEALFSQVAMRDAEALIEAVAVPVAEAAADGLQFRFEDDGFVDDFLAAARVWLTRRPSFQAVLDHAERELASRARGAQFLEDRRAIESLLAEVRAAVRAAASARTGLCRSPRSGCSAAGAPGRAPCVGRLVGEPPADAVLRPGRPCETRPAHGGVRDERAPRPVEEGPGSPCVWLHLVLRSSPRTWSASRHSSDGSRPTCPKKSWSSWPGCWNVSRDVLYYLEDDPLYDAGHDVAQADFSAVRGIAARELARRGREVPQRGGS